MSLMSSREAPDPRRQVRLVVGAVFVVSLAQMTLNPVIAPLARAVGLAEWQVGLVISLAAATVVALAGPWGRRSQSWGRKPVLVTTMGLATLASAAFALTAWWGLRGALTGAALFASWLVIRGLAFGAAMAGVTPTAQAFVADITPDEATRVRGMAGIGAAQGMAMIAGAVLGGSLAAVDLLTPLVVVPLLLGTGVVLLVRGLLRQPPHELVAAPAGVRVTDPRVWPFLLTGFGMFTALGFIQVLTGFLVQDRFGVETERAALLTGAVLLAAGVGMVIAQTVVVPRSGWPAGTLLRVGIAVAAVGFGGLVPDLPIAWFVLAVLLIGLGLGIAVPGYTAGPTLAARPDEQGSVAGLVAATNAGTFVVAPAAATALYGIAPVVPLVAACVTILLVLVLTLTHPRLRPTATAREAAQDAPGR